MGVAVNAQLVTALAHLTNQFGVLANLFTQHKKRAPGTCGLERVENLRRDLGVGAIVESERHFGPQAGTPAVHPHTGQLHGHKRHQVISAQRSE